MKIKAESLEASVMSSKVSASSKRYYIYSICFLLITFYGAFSSAFSPEDFCITKNKDFTSRYFSVQTNSQELEEFFDCMDNTIQLFLNHTNTGNPNYYTQVELRRFMEYMGATREKAEEISKAILNLKTGFIGGSNERLTMKEIKFCRTLLSILKQRMRAIQSVIPTFVKILKKEHTSRKELLVANSIVYTNLTTLGAKLSSYSFASQLQLLEHLPKNLQTLDFSSENLKYWKPALSLLSKWNKIFLKSSNNNIQSSKWPILLDSFAQLSNLWFYYKRFLEGRSWIDNRVIQHTQYFLSHALKWIQDAQKQAGTGISLNHIDELAKQAWFLPVLSQPIFRLGLRSTFCFVLNPLTSNQICEHKLDFKKEDINIEFSDLTFIITNEQNIQEAPSGNTSNQITKGHLDTLRSYLNAWIRSENHIRKNSSIPELFGSPHKWIKRKIDVISGGALLVYKNRSHDLPLFSHLNWQSHLMKLVKSAYTNRNQDKVTQKLWNTMIKEWTPFSISLYKDMKWQNFQQVGFQVFNQGDFLTSSSNGNSVLEDKEILELFSLFTSSLSTTLSALATMKSCQSVNTYYLYTQCVWDHLQYFPEKIFKGFPDLTNILSQDENKKTSYNSKLITNYNVEGEISFKNLFEMFLFMHYQENMMEYLDKDKSHYLSVREVEPLLDIFEQTIIDDIPLIYSKRGAFAFITYLLHFGEIPIFDNSQPISAPMHFSQWFMQPQKWQLQVDRENMLHTLFLINAKIR